jgi:hypothetical protein
LSSLSSLKPHFLWKEYLFSKHKFVKNQEWDSLYVCAHFISQLSFIKEWSQLLFLFPKIAEVGRTPFVFLFSLKIIGIILYVYKSVVSFLFQKPPLGYDQLLNTNKPKTKYDLCVRVSSWISQSILKFPYQSSILLITSIILPRSLPNQGSSFLKTISRFSQYV